MYNAIKGIPSPEERAEALLSRMTLHEKIMQTCSLGPNTFVLTEEECSRMLKQGDLPEAQTKLLMQGIGALQLPGKDLEPKYGAIYRNLIQKWLRENTRLGIPALIQEECLNGQLAKGATMFPRPIALASSFDQELVRQVYDTIGQEVRSRGGHQAFTPVLDVGRDPRWGRFEETFGEDTCLATQMGMAVVEGLQGGREGVTAGHIISSPKHFAGYAQVAGGRNFAPSVITERMLRDEILPPFEAAVRQVHAGGIMPSHSEIDGVPCHGNPHLLREILREEWGFEGITVSDYNDVLRLDILHHVAQDKVDAAAMGLRAGVDMDLPEGSAYQYLEQAIERDPSLEEQLNEAVLRILRTKFAMGLFDDPYVDVDALPACVHTPAADVLAQIAAERSIVLLKNNDRLLPLEMDKLKTIAVIGPTADPVEFSYYSARPNRGTSILEGIREKVQGHCNVLYEMGCHITKDGTVIETELDLDLSNPVLYAPEEEEDAMQRAVAAAAQADVAVVCLGGSPNSSREAVTLEKHYGDNASLDLVGQQNELLRRILATGTPVVVVLINGKPFSCGYVYDHAPAVLEGWYLGQQTGRAVANVLFGEVNPGARLPVTIPRNSGFLPAYYSQKPTAFLKGYLFEKNEPYFWFGYGLSYTSFAYENLRLDTPCISRGEHIHVCVDVRNTGDREGEEVVQLYVSDPQASVVRPERELKRFRRIRLRPGECRTVEFCLSESDLCFTGKDGRRVAEPGLFVVHVGTNCRDTKEISFRLVEE